MNIYIILSLVIFCLAMYGCIKQYISDVKERNQASNRSSKCASRDISSILHRISGLLFVLLLLCLIRTKFEMFILLFLIPAIVLYVFVTLSASHTVGSLAMSAGYTPLTKDETSSLLFIGILLGFTCVSSAIKWNENVHNEKTLVQCAGFAIEVSAYFFMIGTLSINPIKDIAKLLISIEGKLKTYYKKCVGYIRERIIHGSLAKSYSEKIRNIQKASNGWRKYLWLVLLVIVIPIDILKYLLSFVWLFFLWIPLFFVIAIIGILGKYCLGVVRWTNSLSDRRVIVISFRIAIVAALLLLVVLNEYGIIITSQETTSVVEFIASVCIIPIVFEWIHSALRPTANIE